MTNKLKALRESAGISQKELAKRAGVSQLQIHRIESNKRPAPLALARVLCAAIGRSLNSVFPGSAKILTAIEKQRSQGKHPPDDTHERLREVGIEGDCRVHTLKMLLRGHDEPMFLSLPAREVDGIFDRVQDEEDETEQLTFMVFDTDDLRVAINLRELVFCHLLWDAGFTLALSDDQVMIESDETDPREAVQVYLAGERTPLSFGAESEASHDIENEGSYFNRILFVLCIGSVQQHQRLHFVDEDGESAFLRAGDVAMLTVPLWVLDPDERFYDDDPDENDDVPPSPVEGDVPPSPSPPQMPAG